MRGQRREGRTPSVEPELRFGSHTAVVFYPLILLKSLKEKFLNVPACHPVLQVCVCSRVDFQELNG